MARPAPGKRFHRLLLGAFILTLVLSQSLALAHQHALDHPSSHDCALCLYAQHSGDGIPSTPFHFSATASGFVAIAASVNSLLCVTSPAFRSRAPPVALK